MNTIAKWMVMMLVLLVATRALMAQSKVNGYWVVEGNLNKRDYAILHFYDGQNKLIREERLDGQHVDITRRKNVKMLNRRLRDALKGDSLTTRANRKSKRKW